MPGDKSIAHRALILGALAGNGQSAEGMPDSGDLRSTTACLQALGCRITAEGAGRVRIAAGSWKRSALLDAGNSGTTARLLAGLVAGLGLECTIDGDASLRRRPMSRIAEPLTRMGADVQTAAGDRLPMRIRGGNLRGITCRLPVASAQVKSAILLAGLRAAGTTTIIEPSPTRDHTEQMLSAMGVPLERSAGAITITGGATPKGVRVTVPGDVSSATFFLVAAVAHADAAVRLPGIGVNPTRTGALRALQEMGATITLGGIRTSAGEPIADLDARSSALRGIEIAGDTIPTLIDELPVLAVAATQAAGTTTVRNAGELRHKESDRIRTTVANLTRLGAEITEREDGFVVRGPTCLKGTTVDAFGDHRIAMAMAVAGLLAEGTTTITGSEAVGISYPDFFTDLRALME